MKILSFMLALLPLAAMADSTIDTEQTRFTTNQEFTSAQKQEVQKIILKTIASNKKLINQQLENYKQDKIANKQTQDFELITKNHNKLFSENTNISFGDPKANISIIEFIDYRCKHCKDLSRNIKRTIKSNPKLKLIIKELPTLGKESENAAKAVLAAKKQGKYLKFQDYLTKTSDEFNFSNLAKAADEIGLDVATFKKDFYSDSITKYLEKNKQLAASLGIRVTPTIIFSSSTSGKIIPGTLSISEINSAIASLK